MKKIKIADVKIPESKVCKLNRVPYEELVSNIKKHGMLNPVVVDKDSNLLHGYGRLKAAESAGLTVVPVEIRRGSSDE